ncbi:hypothetical protein DPSP01_013504 [Paraphaeosphaeria sporulosa]|uniref:DUF4048 domain-containing protein n=1 Tax=Paraphaeosphaeria sporulosa TaxID=1460663 RepID=A0A177CD28_9PLEO|nr:uncharacterized protein CC84DRAFT_1165151 [Paraphaeosphaeria sporulosa]OAG04772.1 hypothetical protein CC84DRAFT_1165151 [Paraphaeosphaeria sporulosa]
MGNSASPALLKAWLYSWLKSGFLLRLIGLPAAILALHFELSESSHRYSVILHRLSSRLRLAHLTCRLAKGHGIGAHNIFYLGGADVMDRAQHKPASSRKRSSTPDDKERASGAAPSSTVAASQQTSGAASTSSTLSHPSPTPDMHSHARSMSHADIVRQGKRLSLQFPIQPAAAGSSSPAIPSPRSRPQSWIAAPSPVPSPDSTSAETNILNIIAAQERFVLELKEELTKAEQDLKTLKKHYATQEAVKVRNDLRKVTKLQPLNTSLANHGLDQDDEDGSSSWMQKEMERRKALLSAKATQRGGKVFSGSRHLRTLSLLSPDKNYTPSFPQPLDLRHDDPPTPATSTSTASLQRPAIPTRQSASPDIANQIANTVNGERYDLGGLSNIQREALLRTGKQMANDFKDGFFTFIEDIRQATVGDDAINAAEGSAPGTVRDAATKGTRKASENRPTLNRASSSKKSAPSKVDIGDEFWKEHGLSEPKASPTHKKTHALKQTRTPQKQTASQADDFDSWDNWETPSDNHVHAAKISGDSNSSDESEGPSSPASGQVSSRTSTRYHSQRHDSKASTHTASSSVEESSRRDSKRNSIPWPELSKLSPSQLKRTASHLMKEWEKNLTPPPESRDFNHASGDYIGRSVSPSDFA